jgi:hypothetical protein
MKRTKKTGSPHVSTTKGNAVLLGAVAYQDVATHLDSVASIRRGLTQAREGLGRPVDDVFDKLERRAMPRKKRGNIHL